METEQRLTVVPESNESSTDRTDAQGRAPTLHIQTGVRAGGYYDDFYSKWGSASSSYNAADRATGAGG